MQTVQSVYKVLDHGYVRYVDHMGSDESIVEAARTSMGRGFVSWEPYKRCKRCSQVAHRPDTPGQFSNAPDMAADWCGPARACDWQDHPRGDLGLLEYMMKNDHTSPFEMCELIIDVMVPMDAWRQWIRHRTANVNEYSTRYAEAIDLRAQTDPDAWRTQSKTNKQGSGAFLPGVKSDPYGAEAPGVILSMREVELHEHSQRVYEERLKMGVAKEQARKDLPLSTYTAARWKCDLHNLFHFLGKRLDKAAQLEIRLYAQAVAQIAKALWPRAYALFEEHKLYGARLSRSEVTDVVIALETLLARDDHSAEYRERVKTMLKKLTTTRKLYRLTARAP